MKKTLSISSGQIFFYWNIANAYFARIENLIQIILADGIKLCPPHS